MIKLDLHGYTIHNAWKEFTRHVNECFYNAIKAVKDANPKS